jgi:hypothetical protein
MFINPITNHQSPITVRGMIYCIITRDLPIEWLMVSFKIRQHYRYGPGIEFREEHLVNASKIITRQDAPTAMTALTFV